MELGAVAKGMAFGTAQKCGLFDFVFFIIMYFSFRTRRTAKVAYSTSDSRQFVHTFAPTSITKLFRYQYSKV